MKMADDEVVSVETANLYYAALGISKRYRITSKKQIIVKMINPFVGLEFNRQSRERFKEFSERMSVNVLGIFTKLASCVTFPDNNININDKDINEKLLCAYLDVSEKTLRKALIVLEDEQAILRGKKDGKNQIYINPHLHNGGYISIETSKMFISAGNRWGYEDFRGDKDAYLESDEIMVKIGFDSPEEFEQELRRELDL